MATSAAKSASNCEDLGWTNAESIGDSAVCGETKPSGECSGEVTWSEAKDFCEGAGARLCKIEEIADAEGTGCRYDGKLLWTSTACANGYSAVPGIEKPTNPEPRCEEEYGEGIYTRCCADVAGAPVGRSQAGASRFS